MARKPSEGVLQLHLVTSIDDPSAPTIAEVEAGTDLSGFLVPSLSTPGGGQVIQSPDVGSSFTKTGAGTHGGQPYTAEFYRDDTADTAWDALPPGTTGFFVVARMGGSDTGDALQATDLVDVYAIEVADRSPTDVGENEHQRFVVTAAVTDDPNEQVAIAAA